MRLRTQLILAFVLIGVVPLVLVSSVAVGLGRGALVRAYHAILQQQAAMTQTRLNLLLRQWRGDSVAWASTDVARLATETQDRNLFTHFVREKMQGQPDFELVLALDAEGVVFAAVGSGGEGRRPALEDLLGTSMAGSSWYPKVWNSRGKDSIAHRFVSVPELHGAFPDTTEWLLVPVVTMDDFGLPLGFWISAIRAERVNRQVFGGEDGDSGVTLGAYGVVFDFDRRILLCSQTDGSADTPEKVPFWESREAGMLAEVYRGTGLGGEEALVYVPSNRGYPSLIATKLRVASVAPEAVVMQSTEVLMLVVILVGGLVLVLVGGISFYLVGRRILRPVDKLAALAESMGSQGDAEDPEEGADSHNGVRDEVGRLVLAFHSMLAQFVQRIAETVALINTSSTRILESSNRQEIGASGQSRAVEQVGQTLDTLVAWGKEITEAAHTVLKNAETTQANNQRVAERIGELSRQTERIAQILDIIKDIAKKSEILALNASLEGTKAGEAGRGFSLVATQMHRLAENVMLAVADIRGLTADVRAATTASILATEEATKLADDTTKSARHIKLGIERQQEGTQDVSLAMADVADIARESVFASRNVYEATKSLTELSDQLEGLVGRFTVVEPTVGAAPGRVDSPPS